MFIYKEVSVEKKQKPVPKKSKKKKPVLKKGEKLEKARRLLRKDRQRTRVQREMEMSKSTDSCELEADSVARKIVSMNKTDIQKQSVSESNLVQAKSTGSAVTVTPEIESAINNLQGGQSLSESERNYFETRFGADFSGVKVHNNVRGHELASSIQARAFTKGSDIVFGAGEYDTGTERGKKLMAHELTHVLQQNNNTKAKGKVQRVEAEESTSLGTMTQLRLQAALGIVRNIPRSLFGSFPILFFIVRNGAIGFLQRLIQTGGTRVNAVLYNAMNAFQSWEYIRSFGIGIWEGFKGGARGILQLGQLILQLPNALVSFGRNVIDFFGDRDFFADLLTIGGHILSLRNAVSNNIVGIIQSIFGSTGSLNLGTAARFFENLIKSARGGLQRAGSSVANSFIRFFSQPQAQIAQTTGSTFGRITGTVLFEVAIGLLTAGAGIAFNSIRRVLSPLFNLLNRVGVAAVNGIRSVVSRVRQLYTLARGGLTRFFTKLPGNIGERFRRLMTSIRNFIDRLWSKIVRRRRAAREAAEETGEGASRVGREGAEETAESATHAGRELTEEAGEQTLQGAVNVYRVEGLPNTRIHIGESGEIVIAGNKTLFLNFGDRRRAVEFLNKRITQGMEGVQIKSFQVSQSFFDDVIRNAIPESMARQFPGKPIIVDITRARNQIGLRGDWIKRLLDSII